MLGITAYYGYQQRQIAQQRQNTSLNQESQIKTLQSKIVLRDAEITQLKQETKHSQSLFATFSNVVYDMVFVVDVDCIIIAYSESVRSLVDVQNLIGQKLCDVIVDPDLEAVVMHAINEDEGFEEQFTLDNRYFRVQAQRYPVADNQFFIGVALQDITQLVRLNRARRDMVANISHELGTPVANIRIIIDSLFYDQTRPKRNASIDSLRAIARETEALQWTVQELLDLSMIESGQAIVKLVDEPLLEIVNAAIERVDEKLDRKNLNIVRHVPAKIRVSCDRDHIRRVIVNLISNAIKWSPQNEAITISATIDGEYVIVSIFDNGVGVPDDQCERIFERFYQVDTARTGQGSGLGLAISKHIAEAHGGKIWAEGNSQGAGGRFLFTLLNRTPENAENGAMDRGQHDVVLNPHSAVTPNSMMGKNDSIHHDDEGEIEFVDEDDWDD
ncbi:MAG: HAMP domain-containing sensor histidine kinase [Anaerolineae bacterium]|nr:HAMP domain-containing sensor histidine kinase [Anaerolineae bacterium]